MEQMSPALVQIVRSYLKGAKLAKFNASIAVLNESLAQGSWIKRGSVKAHSGFYQGIVPYFQFERNYSAKDRRLQSDANDLTFTLNWGRLFVGKDVGRAIECLRVTAKNPKTNKPALTKISDEVIRAWVELCAEKQAAFDLLRDARPKPVITKIGLSPKVTKTLKECGLDIELSSIVMAKIDFKWVKAFHPVTMKPIIDKKTGKQAMEKFWFVKWSEGIVHNASRFSSGCEACGKWIPSGVFVPIEAKDKRSGKTISMWLGCDCARNIFGVKDIGIKKPKSLG